MNTELHVGVDGMDTLLALLLAAVGFAIFIFIVSRSVKFIVFAAVAIVAVVAVIMFGGGGI
jgi:membrane protein YdbS with pleckstrin-like domain